MDPMIKTATAHRERTLRYRLIKSYYGNLVKIVIGELIDLISNTFEIGLWRTIV
jgi:hypothetical protein